MHLSLTDIEKIAHLARLSPNQPSAEIQHTLERVFELIATMNQVDTDGVAPLAHPIDAHQRLRDDRVTVTHDPALQTIAPETEAGLYLVPQVIE